MDETIAIQLAVGPAAAQALARVIVTHNHPYRRLDPALERRSRSFIVLFGLSQTRVANAVVQGQARQAGDQVRCIGGAKPADVETVDATADDAGQSVVVTRTRRSCLNKAAPRVETSILVNPVLTAVQDSPAGLANF